MLLKEHRYEETVRYPMLSYILDQNLSKLFIYLCLNAAKHNETKDKWFLEFPSTGAFVGSVFYKCRHEIMRRKCDMLSSKYIFAEQ